VVDVTNVERTRWNRKLRWTLSYQGSRWADQDQSQNKPKFQTCQIGPKERVGTRWKSRWPW